MNDSHIAEVVKRAMKLKPGQDDMFVLTGCVNLQYNRLSDGVYLLAFFPAVFQTHIKYVQFFQGKQNRDANAAVLALALRALTEAAGVV